MVGETPHNRVFNHVAVSVSDIQATVNWYSRVFGFKLLGKISHIKRSETPDAAIFGIYPSTMNEVKLAYMATGNGVGFEIFEFVDPKPQHVDVFQYERKGFFHICVTDPNPDELADKVEAAGGKRIGKTVDPSGNGDTKCLYLSDPWGNVVEVLSVSFEWLGCRTAY
ncbi:hypothetical protein DTO164E3_5770 [Paecilomyces variotii]|nr:hypothetical protein DTO164E3_5770 [Paecilomyces variotii]KAJ9199540.1 hypothetical protein DTO032I3_5063 [Paecilomyces variotii]KAJ9223868.1 hypothetical protein DTO169C6_3738 [Paecilomyces variotii]KAJ9233317.1 hypothetical protein DTO169E5_7128 [Paecilomyces variotii]KAJ9254155.1 hypothetical protein DTO207G8_3732 [Paecilomyces variotii]